MTSREKFEAWWEENYHNGNPPRFGWEAWRDGDGYKIDDDESELDGMWQAWQAAESASEQKLEESQREFRAADATIHNLELKLTDQAVQLANAESKCSELAAESGVLKKAAEFATAPDMWIEQADGMLDYRYFEWYVDVLKAAMETPATDAFLAEVRDGAIAEYASKRGFSFKHGSIHAHFGNGDVMVGSVTFENGDAGINFAPVREKTGGVGTSYEWTNGKTTEQVDSVFTIASSNAEGLEVIRDKLSESIAQLRKGASL